MSYAKDDVVLWTVVVALMTSVVLGMKQTEEARRERVSLELGATLKVRDGSKMVPYGTEMVTKNVAFSPISTTFPDTSALDVLPREMEEEGGGVMAKRVERGTEEATRPRVREDVYELERANSTKEATTAEADTMPVKLIVTLSPIAI